MTALFIIAVVVLLIIICLLNNRVDELTQENRDLISDINTLQAINDLLVEDKAHMVKQLKSE